MIDFRILEPYQKVCLFCNQSSFDFEKKKYLFDILIEQNKLAKILLPEHGLFAEIQDQVPIENRTYKNIPCHSLYDKQSHQEQSNLNLFDGIDAILMDIQDVGVRYFTYISHLFYLLSALNDTKIPIFIIDRPNPIGKKVEGTVIQADYASFLGSKGLIHRHGMSVGDLAKWYVNQNQLSLNITLLDYKNDSHFFIPPSPNLPTENSLLVYPGQCFWEATTFSEGRGTTRPFEIFGHPHLTIKEIERIAAIYNLEIQGISFLRPTQFKPTFHKHQHQNCFGWQLFVENKEQYHSIFSTLFLMRIVKENCPNLEFWLKGTYEFDSTYTAAQTLIGDDRLIDFVNGKITIQAVKEIFSKAEQDWGKRHH